MLRPRSRTNHKIPCACVCVCVQCLQNGNIKPHILSPSVYVGKTSCIDSSDKEESVAKLHGIATADRS